MNSSIVLLALDSEEQVSFLRLVEILDENEVFEPRTKAATKQSRTRGMLDELIAKKLVIKEFNKGAYRYALTDLGRKEVKANL